MTRLLSTIFALSVLLGGAVTASAQRYEDQNHRDDHGQQQNSDHRDDHGPQPQANRWHEGGRIDRSDWQRGQHIDYREHHLRKPPRGHEWRQVDGNYVLAATVTGIISSIIANSQ
jgi:Ni/Co efflux regulator RcnB